ncbi:MAG: glycoside hydrolase family 3 C-terminal domain-containing protein, partial [Gemmatimonadota bacterium]|nr:glycoside hydrolase family 3 C-terminal domain-containing protein [Gemmatimonadota bacterium]
SDEARAKYDDAIAHDRHDRFAGLTFWSPNVNIFRDPRWGRGQETYGEDPFLSGRLAVQFVRGMQGDDPRYLETVATEKHFAVHSGPEPERHVYNAVVSPRDLRETYLAQFRAGIVQGGAYSVMCAYSDLDGLPACANPMLLDTVLRRQWGFAGYVVSDCDAVADIYRTHQQASSAAAAAAAAVKAGTDLDCGNTFAALPAAVDSGFISEARIDTAVDRLFLARFRLGMFDPPDSVPWSHLGMRDVDTPAHRALALRAARESMVLLKNDGHVLPLRRDPGTIAVIGPDADAPDVLLGNYNGSPGDSATPLRGIREEVAPGTRVLYAQGSELAEGFPVLAPVPAEVFDGAGGLRVTYFGTHAMEGAPMDSAVDSTVDAGWSAGAPRPGMNAADFGVRWAGTLRAPANGVYAFQLQGTVRYDLWLDDTLVLSSSRSTRRRGAADSALQSGEFASPLTMRVAVALDSGRAYRFRLEASQSGGGAGLRLAWAPPQTWLESRALDAAARADAVVLVLGLTSAMEGEESSLRIPGFDGGDRTSIDLPAPQEELMRRVVALGKPTVLVLMNGGALAANWAQDHVPAIVEAWYPGQAGGTALADVLFGAYDPGGRLPVTFYRTLNDLPPFDSYDMAGRTYRFFDGRPLYPFGFGLSYTTFAYSNLRTSAGTIGAGDTLAVRVDVTNTGAVAGDEVVQLYAAHPASAVPRAREDLRDYARVHLTAGETRTVTLHLAARSLAYWNPNAQRWVVEAEPVQLRVGASSADIRLTGTVRVRAGSFAP